MKRFKQGTYARELIDAFDILAAPKQIERRDEPELEHALIAKSAELRYTLGPVYMPDVIDAHGEFANEDDIRKAMWELSSNMPVAIRKQHGPERIGTLRELFQWPFEQRVELTVPGAVAKTKELVLPAGTAYAGVEWMPRAWADVKSGKINGYSMGGRAVRVRNVEATGLRKLS